MKHKSVGDFFPQQNIISHKPRKLVQMPQNWSVLAEDTAIDGISFAAGSQYKAFETKNFGWVVFHPDSKCPDGNTPGRRIFKF